MLKVRNRKQPHRDDQNSNSNSNNSNNSKQSSVSSLNHNDKSNNSSNNASPTRKYVSLSSWYVAIGVASIAIVSYFVYFGYLVSIDFYLIIKQILANQMF